MTADDTARVFLAEIELAAAARAADALNGVISATIATIETHSESIEAKAAADIADAEKADWWEEEAARADRIGEAAEAYFGPIDPRFAGEYAPRTAATGTAIDEFLAAFGITEEHQRLKHLYKLIDYRERAYVVDDPGGCAGTLVENLGVDAAELYVEALQDEIARRRSSG